jgi:N-acyl homoserine lactone hydrolase
MKIVEFDDKGRRIEIDAKDLSSRAPTSALAARPVFTAGAPEPARQKRKSNGIELHMFQTGTLKTKTKYIKTIPLRFRCRGSC